VSDRVDSAEKSNFPRKAIAKVVSWIPGIALCALVTLIAVALQALQEATVGHPYVEAIVIAILLGTAIRTIWEPNSRWNVGIALSAKQLLEVAVALLGASITFAAIAASGPILLGAIVATVILTIAVSYGISRALGLSNRLSILIACGNSICGNSAIAAVAPVIGANSDEVASSIAFTAVLGVVVVLGLPLLVPLFILSETQYGILAGMTVYAVPQVLAATVPVSVLSTQVGTVVKLVRVMMLGPVVACIALFGRNLKVAQPVSAPGRHNVFKAVPWFIVVFFALAALRSLSLIPDGAIAPLQRVASLLTVLSMAALGLGVDLRVIGQVGGKVTAAVTLSLAFLLVVSLCFIRYVIPS
jgi:uncharacterized integral membrane protein (TIGR00698 family)